MCEYHRGFILTGLVRVGFFSMGMAWLMFSLTLVGGFRDHVFFFSFATTKQEGAVLGMWSDADALAKLNSAWFPFLLTVAPCSLCVWVIGC
jgi:hypothetical protein